MSESSQQPGFVRIDFVRYFPHRFWISDWSEDDQYPDGFRYKVLGVRDEDKQVVELVLLLEAQGGKKEEMHRAQVKIAAADRYAHLFVDGLAKEHGLDFEEQDFTDVRTVEEFDQTIAAHGWSGHKPQGEDEGSESF